MRTFMACALKFVESLPGPGVDEGPASGISDFNRVRNKRLENQVQKEASEDDTTEENRRADYQKKETRQG